MCGRVSFWSSPLGPVLHHNIVCLVLKVKGQHSRWPSDTPSCWTQLALSATAGQSPPSGHLWAQGQVGHSDDDAKLPSLSNSHTLSIIPSLQNALRLTSLSPWRPCTMRPVSVFEWCRSDVLWEGDIRECILGMTVPLVEVSWDFWSRQRWEDPGSVCGSHGWKCLRV